MSALRRLLRRFARAWVRPWIRVTIAPESAADVGIAPGVPVVYALHVRQYSALVVLDVVTQRLGLPSPFAPLREAGLDERSAFLFLTRRGQPSPLRRRPYAYASRLVRIVEAAGRDPALDVQIVPVSVFWGRAPGSDHSLLQLLFADSWRAPGLLRQMVRVLLHGRQTLARVGRPIRLRALVDQGEAETALRRVARHLRMHFRVERERAIGPNLSHRDTLINELVESDTVRFAIVQDARRTGKTSEHAERRARRLAVGIASDFSYRFVLAFDVLLTALWQRIYNGVEVRGLDALAGVPGGRVVYVPCHRSHIDYLLLSYVLFHRGMQVPHIAAGDNLNLPIVGRLLRKGGAFFLRRSFKGDRLYATLFAEYLHAILQRGFPIEYFVEGGRSRTGFTLAPRAGLVAMTLDSHLRDPGHPLAFVPVYIGYEMLIEGDTYVAELLGTPKRRESLAGLVRGLRKLRRRWGRAYLNFGEPILLDAFLDEQRPGWREHEARARQDVRAGVIDDSGAGPQQALVGELARRIVAGINDAVVVHPVSLLALVLLGTPRLAIDAALLARQVDLLQRLLLACPYSSRQQLVAPAGAEVIAYGEQNRVLERLPNALGDVLRVREADAVLLHYFRNNVLHAFALPGLLACLIAQSDWLERAQVHRVARLLFPVLRETLFLSWDEAENAARVEATIGAMVVEGLLRPSGETLHAPAVGSVESMMLHGLGQCMRLPLERYFVVVATLVQAGSGAIAPDALETVCAGIAERASVLHVGLGPQFADRAAIQRTIAVLLDSGAASLSGGRIAFGDALVASAADASLLLSADTRLAIAHAAQQSVGRLAASEAVAGSDGSELGA